MSKSKISNNYLPILEDFVKNGGMELLIKSGYDQGPFHFLWRYGITHKKWV